MSSHAVVANSDDSDISKRPQVSQAAANARPAAFARPRLLMQGTVFASVAITMGFLALIGHYLTERAAVLAQGEVWLPKGVSIPLTQPNYIGVSVSFSVISVWWAASAVRNNDRGNALNALGLTLMFAVAYFAQTFYLFTIMEIDVLADERSVLLYVIIGSHLAITLAGFLYLIGAAFRTIAGEVGEAKSEFAISAATFWTVVAALYGVMWYAIYITK